MNPFRRPEPEPQVDPLAPVQEHLDGFEASLTAIEASVAALSEQELPSTTNLVIAEALPESVLPIEFTKRRSGRQPARPMRRTRSSPRSSFGALPPRAGLQRSRLTRLLRQPRDPRSQRDATVAP
jgi:hypothetical protein